MPNGLIAKNSTGFFIYEGISHDENYATLIAGKKVWEALKDEKFPYTKCFLDEECTTPSLNYNFVVVDPNMDIEKKAAPMTPTFKLVSST